LQYFPLKEIIIRKIILCWQSTTWVQKWVCDDTYWFRVSYPL